MRTPTVVLASTLTLILVMSGCAGKKPVDIVAPPTPATAGAAAPATPVVAPAPEKDIFDELVDNEFIAHIKRDVARTRAWATSAQADGTITPWQFYLANLCPVTLDHVDAVWTEKVYAFRDLLRSIKAPTTSSGGSFEIDVIYLATLRALGPTGGSQDPIAMVKNLRKDFQQLVTDLNAGCGWLVQSDLNKLYVLLARAGIIAYTGGAAAPLVGGLGAGLGAFGAGLPAGLKGLLPLLGPPPGG